MSATPWLSILGWKSEQLDDLCFVAYSYLKQGKYDMSLCFFEALHVLDPSNEYYLQTLGALYLQMGNNLAALDFLERALKANPKHGPTLLNRIKVLLVLGYKKQALIQAKNLEKNGDPMVARQAEALFLAHS